MDTSTRDRMLQYIEGKADGSAAVELTTDDLFSMVDSALYPSNGPMAIGSGTRAGPAKALAALDGLEKIGFEDRDIESLRDFFNHMLEAEELRQDASRALQRLRDEFYDDREQRRGQPVSKNMTKG